MSAVGNVKHLGNEGRVAGRTDGAHGFRIVPGVQYLRGLCALLVVISHENGFLAFPEYFGRSVFPSLHEAAVFSVAAFFAISGFIIVATSLDEQGFPLIDRRAFMRKRVVRIVPFLWLCTALYTGLRLAGTGSIDTGSLARTLVIWPTGELRPNVAWSLRHEMAFYAMFALTMLGTRKAGILLLGWLLAPVAVGLWMTLGGQFPSDLEPWSASAALANLVGGGANGANLQFMSGMVLGMFYLRGRLAQNLPAWLLPAAFAVACAIVLAWPLEPGLARHAVWTALAAGLVYIACRTGPAPGIAGRCGLLFGNASFSIYLVHNLVMLVLLELSLRAGLAPASAPTLGAYLAACVIVSVGICCAVHHRAERPVIALADRLWRAWGARTVLAR